MFEPNTNVIMNSNKEVFLFKLSKDGEITYSIFDSSLKLLESKSFNDKNIINYSTLIDENNIIHLVALIGTGELNYYKSAQENWSKATIAKFDIKSNIYNQLEILMVKNNLHIIYNYSNLINSNIWTIQHVIYGNEEKHNAIRYISKKTPEPFIVDVDNQGTIHILYKNNINNPQIYHSFYSPYTRAWSSLSKQISTDNSNNLFPCLLIDTQNNLHGLWLEELDNRLQIKYLRMSSSGKEKYIWKDVNLPYIQLGKYPPILYEENNKLILVFLSNDNISYLYSTNYGISWIAGNNIEKLNQNILLVKIKSNINKINYVYCNISDNPRFYFLDSFPFKEPKMVYESLSVESINKESDSEPIDTASNLMNELDSKLDNILDNYYSIESILTKIIENQGNIINKLNKIENSINEKKQSFINKLFN